MTKTTIDIDDLTGLKHTLLDKKVTLRGFVNAAIKEKLERDAKDEKAVSR